MLRILKIIFRIVLGIFLLLIIVAGAFWFFGDEILKSVRPRIESELSDLVQGHVTFSTIRARIVPVTDIYLENLVISPKDSCGSIKIDAASLSLDPWALLARKLAIDRISFDRPHLSLVEEAGELSLARGDNLSCGTTPKQIIPASNPQVQGHVGSSMDSQSDSIEFQLEQLDIHDAQIDLNLKGKAREIKIKSFSTAARLDGGLLKLSRPAIIGGIDRILCKVDAGSIEFDLQKRNFALDKLSASINGQRMLISGNLQASGFPASIKLEAELISLPTIVDLVSMFSPKMNSLKKGLISGSLRFEKSDAKSWSLNGSTALMDLAIPESQFSLGEFKINDLSITANGEVLDGKANVSIAKFGLRNNSEIYSAQKVSGPIAVSKRSKNLLLVNAGFSVEDFGYSDDETKLEHVWATLEDVKASVGAGSDVKVDLKLNGTRLELDHPEIKVISVHKVSAPITVAVPRSGGYSVSGPVSIEGTDLVSNNRTLSKLSGRVEMLVSGPLKRFTTKEIRGVSQKRAISIATDFAMRPEEYTWKDNSVRLEKGLVKADLTLGRRGKREYAAKISAVDIGLGDVLSVVNQKEEDKYSGRLKSVSGAITGSFQDALQSMRGSGQFALTDPLLQNYNLTEKIGAAIAQIPIMGTALVPSSGDDDDVKNAAEGTFTIENGKATFSRFIVRKNRYTINGKGTIGFDLSVDLRASVIFLQETFRSFGLGFDKLGSLIGRAGKISVPIFISGKFPDPAVMPDVETFVKDNSGITLVGSVLTKTANVGGAIGRTILSPFSRSTPTPEPTP